MQICPQAAGGAKLGAIVIGAVIGVVAASLLYTLLSRPRRGNWGSRLIARFIIIGGGATTFGIVAVKVGGPCIFAGQTKHGGYFGDPVSPRGMAIAGLVIGIVGAVLVPLVAKRTDGRGINLDW